jgi:hypothetical protein
VPKSINSGAQGVPRRTLLRGVGALAPGLIMAAAGGSVAAVASGPTAGRAARGTFGAPAYQWSTVASPASEAQAPSGVVFALTAGGLPVTDRRMRFSISSFDEVGRSVWFETSAGPKSVSRLGYLDLDLDASGTVSLDRWLRRGAVPTAAVGARPVLRAQLVGSETILATARLSVV